LPWVLSLYDAGELPFSVYFFISDEPNTSQVNFRSLDKLTIKPLGIYGSILAIANFLKELGVVDPPT